MRSPGFALGQRTKLVWEPSNAEGPLVELSSKRYRAIVIFIKGGWLHVDKGQSRSNRFEQVPSPTRPLMKRSSVEG